MMATITFDDTRAPHYVARFSGADPSTADLRQLLRQLERRLEAGERYTIQLEVPGSISLSGEQRKEMATWIKANSGDLAKCCAGQAFVLPNVVARMVLKSIFLLQGPPTPHVVVRSPEEAEGWCRQQIAESGPLTGKP